MLLQRNCFVLWRPSLSRDQYLRNIRDPPPHIRLHLHSVSIISILLPHALSPFRINIFQSARLVPHQLRNRTPLRSPLHQRNALYSHDLSCTLQIATSNDHWALQPYMKLMLRVWQLLWATLQANLCPTRHKSSHGFMAFIPVIISSRPSSLRGGGPCGRHQNACGVSQSSKLAGI